MFSLSKQQATTNMQRHFIIHKLRFTPLTTALAASCLFAALAESAAAQHGLADLYRRDHAIGARSVERYLFNRHFFHRPSVHPALNLDRPDPSGTTAFHSFVRPEQERREQAVRDQRAYRAGRMQEGRIGETRLPPPPSRARGPANAAPAARPVPQDRFMNTGDRFGTR
jgi:hypothetical protein